MTRGYTERGPLVFYEPALHMHDVIQRDFRRVITRICQRTPFHDLRYLTRPICWLIGKIRNWSVSGQGKRTLSLAASQVRKLTPRPQRLCFTS